MHDVLDVFVLEVAERAEHRVGRCLPKAAQAGLLDCAAEIHKQVQIVHGSGSIADARKQREHLRRSRAAGNALAAGLGHAELDEETRDVDHARRVVHDDHSARSHHRSHLDQRFVTDLQVEMLLGNAAAGRSAGLHCLESVTVRNATADAFDDLAQRNSHGHFNQAGVRDLAGESENLGSLALFRADRGKPLAAFANDRRDVCKSLDVIDQGRLAPKSAYGRIRRPWRRSSAQTFDRGDQCRLFSAYERTGTESNLDVEVERRIADVVAQQAAPPRLAQAVGETGHRERILRAHVDKTLARANRVGRESHALEYASADRFRARCDP